MFKVTTKPKLYYVYSVQEMKDIIQTGSIPKDAPSSFERLINGRRVYIKDGELYRKIMNRETNKMEEHLIPSEQYFVSLPHTLPVLMTMDQINEQFDIVKENK